MAKKEYTQTVKPVSRIAEKIFGWLALIALLAVAVFLLYIAFVSVNDAEVRDAVESAVVQGFQSEGTDNIDGLTPEQLTNAMINLMGQAWMFALYLALPFILGLFGVLTMRRRIMSGFLMLFAGVLTAPLVLFIVTGLIPLFFIIASILLFVRKDIIVKADDMDAKEMKKMRKENDKAEKEREREFERARQLERERELETNNRQPVKSDEWNEDLNDDSDIESTRQFTRIEDDEIKKYESSKNEDLDYDYDDKDSTGDATSERRSNVDRRNSDD